MTDNPFMTVPGLKKSIFDVTPYQPGTFIEEVQDQFGLKEVIKLASNENPYGPYANSLFQMRREVDHLNQYPNSDFGALRCTLADLHGISPDSICISHGAEGMLQTIGKCFLETGDETIIPEATYTLYKEISKIMGAKVVTAPMDRESVSLSAIAERVTDRTKLIWLANPNNPTGTVFQSKGFFEFLQQLPRQTWVILDEAYAEFADPEDLPDRVTLIKKGIRIISVRTFSKAYGLAGARIGYAIASPKMTQVLNTVSEPFNANRIAIAGALAAINEDRDEFQTAVNQIRLDRAFTEKRLAELGLRVIPSNANFIMFESPLPALDIFTALLPYGLIVRPCNAWGYDHMIRVSIGTSDQMDLFIRALKKVLEPQPRIDNDVRTD